MGQQVAKFVAFAPQDSPSPGSSLRLPLPHSTDLQGEEGPLFADTLFLRQDYGCSQETLCRVEMNFVSGRILKRKSIESSEHGSQDGTSASLNLQPPAGLLLPHPVSSSGHCLTLPPPHTLKAPPGGFVSMSVLLKG